MSREPGKRKPLRDEPSLPQWEDELSEGALAELSQTLAAPEEIQDQLRSIPDRADLERLFEKNVTIDQIVQILGHDVNREEIQRLIEASDVQGEIHRLLTRPREGKT